MVTSKSPTVVPFVIPRPLTRRTRPLEVPGAIRKVTSSPVSVGTFISPPSAASVNVTGTVSAMFSPLREKTAWGFTCSNINRSPGPASPLDPFPLTRIFAPSLTPAGTRAEIVCEGPPSADRRSSKVVPKAASLKVIVASVCKSCPLRGPRRPPPPNKLAKISCGFPPPKMSEKSPPWKFWPPCGARKPPRSNISRA